MTVRLGRTWMLGLSVSPMVLAYGLLSPPPAKPTPGPATKTAVATVKRTTLAQVMPIFKAHCMPCHGDAAQGGLRLDTVEGLRKGGVSGKLIVPGKPNSSVLYLRTISDKMGPRMPMGFRPLDAQKTETMRRWIADGGDLSLDGKPPHWAYVAPVKPTIPNVRNRAWVKNPIDSFVLSELEKKGWQPSPPASREKLLRRVTLDLTGLPPTPQEVEAFRNDNRPDAYERVVDRLLNSPAYGERMARPWLDLARYADTHGYEKDASRSIWPYRDWVIRAFNADMPFDQFTMEQMAGDLLPNPTPDKLIATGFHRNTMYNEEGGVDKEEQRWLTLIDRVGTTSTIWMASTVACAQCHDHKYDPFSQKDFYRMLAYFEPSEEPAYEVPDEGLQARRALVQARITVKEAELRDLEAQKAPEESRKAVQAERDRLVQERNAMSGAWTLILREKPSDEVPSTYLRNGGAFLSRGEKLYAGVPEFLGKLPSNRPNNRVALGYWLIDPKNPLTARVQVNRAWELHFGTGIVESSDDFGTQADKPSHPRLLDWLAVTFVERGWKLKQLHRLIVTSNTYRQSSAMTAEAREQDPKNRWLARGPRYRLEAEMIRDTALAASGLLSRKMYGPGVFPKQPDGVWDSPYSGEYWRTSEGEDLHRRSIYTFWKRTSPYPALMAFDATSREVCTSRRIRTNTPLQALVTLNDPAYMDAAKALADRMLASAGGDRDRIAYGFLRCTSRSPETVELDRLERLLQQQRGRYRDDPDAARKLRGADGDVAEAAAWTVLANVLLNLDETLSQE